MGERNSRLSKKNKKRIAREKGIEIGFKKVSGVK